MDGKSPCRQGSEYEKSSSPSPSSLSSSSWLNTKPKTKVKRGAWSAEEDTLLINYIQLNGVKGCWRKLPSQAGLMRSGKSCRLRWMNYLRPDVKIGGITLEEEDLIIRLHKLLGNRWSLIAGRLPGRTDNEIKNYWKGHIRRHLTKINNTHKASCKSIEEKRMESSPIICGIDILQPVNQPIENDEKPFDLGIGKMGISRSMHVHINAFPEKKTSTTSSINYLESTPDYGSRPSFVTQVNASNRKSVPSIITEEGRNDAWGTPICQKIPWIDDYMHSSQISPLSTYINAVYNLQGDMHPLGHHFSFDDASQLMV